jgi:tRNA A-37 threonylcarbamoyl transferase component Bud32
MTITPQKSRTLLYAFIGAAIVAMGLLAKFDSVGSSLQISFLIIAAILTAILFYTSSYYGINYQKSSSPQDDLDYKNIRLALNFQGLGKLDAAFALYKQCKHSEKLITLLKNLAQDYEIIKQSDKADIVYVHISNLQTSFDGACKKTMGIIEEKKPAVKEPTDTSSSLFNERYEIIRNIGKGTGSTIFLAKDHDNDKQAVAIKILEINYDEKNALETELLARFMREAETAASLQHKNIIAVIDSGHANNVAYIAMEYIRGKSLQDHSKPTSLLPQALIIELIAQCADALHYAHCKGIIHRDVKPANILYDHEASLAKLGDFGIAHIANSTQTLAGSFLGTPFYMSPEQLGGLDLDARSDIFSLGATLYRLLTGVPPFSGSSMAKLMHTIVHEPHQNILEIRPNLPNNLVNVVEIALAKNPSQRFSNALEFSEQLRACSILKK